MVEFITNCNTDAITKSAANTAKVIATIFFGSISVIAPELTPYITGGTHTIVEHTTEYFDVIEQEPHPDNPVDPQHDHYAGPPSQRHLSELELFRRFKGKPLWEDWVPDWTAVY